MIEDIKDLLESRKNLAAQAFEQYMPLVSNIIASKNSDVNHISFILDHLLDFCFDDQILLLYRRLCRYLFDINPQEAADYIQAYREMWDEEGAKFGNNKTEGRDMKEELKKE